MNAQSKIKAAEAAPAFRVRATLDKPVLCFAVRLSALLRVRPFISTEETRYHLNGVYVHAHKQGGAVCAATDGHRLGVRRDPSGLVCEPQIVRLPKELKAPTKRLCNSWAVMSRHGASYASLSLVEAIHDPDHDTPQNAFARINECYQRFGDVLIDGTFPDYTRVIPAENEEDAVRGFNGKYLGSFGEHLTIRGGDEGAPHIIFDGLDPEFVGVLMPMRTQISAKQEWAKALGS